MKFEIGELRVEVSDHSRGLTVGERLRCLMTGHTAYTCPGAPAARAISHKMILIKPPPVSTGLSE